MKNPDSNFGWLSKIHNFDNPPPPYLTQCYINTEHNKMTQYLLTINGLSSLTYSYDIKYSGLAGGGVKISNSGTLPKWKTLIVILAACQNYFTLGNSGSLPKLKTKVVILAGFQTENKIQHSGNLPKFKTMIVILAGCQTEKAIQHSGSLPKLFHTG